MQHPWDKLGPGARILWYTPGALWVVIIFILSVIPGNNYPPCILFGCIPLDKLGHLGCYGLMIFCFMPPLQKQYQNVKHRFIAEMAAIIIATSYGIAIEFIQKLPIVHRDFEIGDMIADAN